MKILVDADACPRLAKELLYKTADRLKVEMILVANSYIRVPESAFISCLVVAQGADVADDQIVEMMEANDLIITADIPLADRVIKKQGFVLDPRGDFLTNDNIGQRLAVRNLMDDIRSSGVQTGGPDSYGQKEKQEFANQLDKFLTKVLKNRK